jgi:hypothetical protein
MPTDNGEILLTAVYKSPGHAWIYAHITELLSFRRKSILTGDLNVKHPLWNNEVSNPSGEKLLGLSDVNEFKMSAPQCPTHYSLVGDGDVINIAIHQNIKIVRCDRF